MHDGTCFIHFTSNNHLIIADATDDDLPGGTDLFGFDEDCEEDDADIEDPGFFLCFIVYSFLFVFFSLLFL